MNGTIAAPPPPSGRRLSWWLLAAVLCYLGLTWAFGGADTLVAAGRIGPAWIAAGLVLTTASIGLRAVRWHFLLRAVGARVPPAASGAVYFAGIALGATPGKVGETVRSAFLLRHGVPVGSSLAAFLADRLSDLHAVVLIALLPLAWTAGWGGSGVLRWALVLAAVAASPLVLGALLRLPAWSRAVAAAEGLRPLRAPARWLAGCASEFVGLWRPGVAAWSVAASLVAYGLQALVFAGMVAQVAPQVGPLTAASIFAAATLAGAASFIPGGVGAMELALVLLLRQQGVDGADALAAALCLRAVTFWFGLLLGAAGLSVAGRERRA